MMPEQKVYSLDEARNLVPWLMEASKEAERQVREAQNSAESHEDSQEKIQAIIYHWAETVAKLGGLPKQPFTVDFDSGTDYFCWEYPESDIFYRHGYERGYAGRQRIKDEKP